MPRKAKPVSEIKDIGGIGSAIKAREARRTAALDALESGRLPNGNRVTPNKAMRLRHDLRVWEQELAILEATRESVMADPNSRWNLPGSNKSTAQGAPSSTLTDWE